MASRDYLSFECVWTQKPGDDTDSFLAAYKRFFEAHCGQASVSIERAHQSLPRDSCEDPLWQVNCKLHLYSSLRQNQLETLSIGVARQWCTRGRSGSSLSGHLQWLQPDRQDGFWHSWYAIEKDIRMRSISFGTFAGLNLFAERHTIDSKPRDEGGYAIDCTFKHDERVLQVFLHLRHCVSLEHLYRLTVHYNSIFRVVVYDPVNGQRMSFSTFAPFRCSTKQCHNQ
ncbi:hypothetical protein HPB48_010279 [Haemaphysalis longicornis]|uniref:Uncharacterized protein n=1 Tax=Haemaphysalis longicornis TaxID=44386 RepID=A0A9J6FW42_HAELO|nr:hypothetical protein HPB48_010279 [Haemaphysalis longicornis]